MPGPLPHLRPLLTAALLVGLAACGGDSAEVASNEASPTSSPTAVSVSPTATAPEPTGSAPAGVAATPSATAAAPAADNVFNISFAGGQASGDTGRLEVGVGETVIVNVTSDQPDEAHLHGYDISAPVTPTAPGVVNFTADIPGVFELELEQLGTQLASIQVS